MRNHDNPYLIEIENNIYRLLSLYDNDSQVLLMESEIDFIGRVSLILLMELFGAANGLSRLLNNQPYFKYYSD